MPESTVQTFSPSPANVQPNEYHVASFVGHAINKHIAELTEEITQIETEQKANQESDPVLNELRLQAEMVIENEMQQRRLEYI